MQSGQWNRDLIAFCQSLIRTPSLSGNEGEIAKLIANTARGLGFDSIDIDAYGNIILHIRFSDSGKKLLFHTQMDHVEPGNRVEWSYYPYCGVITNNRLYGRGAADQKGALAAMMQAAASLKESLKNQLGGELIIAAVVQQEKFGGCSSRSIVSNLAPDAVVAGESSNLSIVRGQRGRAKILLEAFGRIAHSSHPELGVNAAEIILTAIDCLNRHYLIPEDDFLGKGDLVLTGLFTTPLIAEKAIPDHCTAYFERKLLLDENKDTVLERFTDTLRKNMPHNTFRYLKTSFAVNEGRCYTGAPLISEQFVPAWVQSDDSPFFKNVVEGIRRARIPLKISHRPGFGTSGCIYAAEQGLPTIIFGPCHQDQPHSVNEYIELDHLFNACRAYYHIAEEYLRA